MDSIVLSVDLELFSQTFAFRKTGRKYPHNENGEGGVDKLLSLFDDNAIKSTFFVTGDICKTHPNIVKRVRKEGHEIASHALSHTSFKGMGKREAGKEVKESKRQIEKVARRKVKGFRSPGLYMDRDIIEALDEAGYKYDSSVMPSIKIPGWYGSPEAPITPGKMSDFFEVDSEMMEFPLATNPLLKLPASGAWIRLLGRRYFMWSVKSLLEKGATPIVYVHPWELVELPDIKGVPLRVTFRTGEYMMETLEHLIREVKADFTTIEKLLK